MLYRAIFCQGSVLHWVDLLWLCVRLLSGVWSVQSLGLSVFCVFVCPTAVSDTEYSVRLQSHWTLCCTTVPPCKYSGFAHSHPGLIGVSFRAGLLTKVGDRVERCCFSRAFFRLCFFYICLVERLDDTVFSDVRMAFIGKTFS